MADTNTDYCDLLYTYLAKIVKLNKQETLDILAVVNEKVDNLVQYIHDKDKRFKNKAKKAGSYYQGLKVEVANEFDYNILLDGFEEIGYQWTDKPYRPRNYRFNRDSKLHPYLSYLGDLGPPIDMDTLDTLPDDLELMPSPIPLENPPAGFTVCPLYSLEEIYSDFQCDGDIVPFLAQRSFKKLLQEAVTEITDFKGEIRQARKLQGPSLPLTIPMGDEEVNIDLAVVIPTNLTIPPSARWPRPGVLWPSPEKIQDVKNAGINLVARHPYYWYISYSNCEKELITKIDQEKHPS